MVRCRGTGGLFVPRTVFRSRMGAGSFHGGSDEAEGIATIHAALDVGVNLIDTGDFYSIGKNELLVGKALAGARRDRALLSVKFGGLRGPDGGFLGHGARPAATNNFLAYSLSRLVVDHIDTYRPARLDPAVPIEETIGAIADMVKAGYVRYIGLSEVGVETIRRAAAVHPICDLQIEYSLVSRSPERAIFPEFAARGMATTAYGVLSRGLLTGSRPGGASDFRAHLPRLAGENGERNRALACRPGPAGRGPRGQAGPACHRLGAGQGGRSAGHDHSDPGSAQPGPAGRRGGRCSALLRYVALVSPINGRLGGKPNAPKIMLIRHAEKPPANPPPHGVDTDGDHDNEALTVRGWQRAGALVVLLAPSAGPLQNNALATPRFVFASRRDKHKGSARPQQTVAPLIDRLGKAVSANFEFGIGEESDLAARAMACDGTVLISWAHGEIPAIVQGLSLSKKTAAAVPAVWPDARFDLIWVFDINPTSHDYRFSQQPQLLLSGDKPV